MYGIGAMLEGQGVPCTGPVATLSDAFQFVETGGKRVEAWHAHHSPRAFDVRAELILSDPPSGCSAASTTSRDE